MEQEQENPRIMLVRKAYRAFNTRDMETILRLMHPQVRWPRAWEGDFVHGRDAVRAYWDKQWQEIDPEVVPLAFREFENGELAVEVHQRVKDPAGKLLSDSRVWHIYRIENGSLQQMRIAPDGNI